MVADFEKNLTETGHGTMVQVQARAGCKQFAASLENGILKVRLQEKPEKGKANKELEKRLKRLFGAEARIIKGKKSGKKTLLVKAKKGLVAERLKSL